MSDLIFQVFVPCHFFESPSSRFLYGFYTKLENCVFINCTYSLPIKRETCVYLETLQRDLSFAKKPTYKLGNLGGCLLIGDDPTFEQILKKFQIPKSEVSLSLCYDNITNEINVTKLFFREMCVDPCNIYLVVYSGTDLFTSKLIYKDVKLLGNSDFDGSFIEFLIESIDFSLEQSMPNAPNVTYAVEQLQQTNPFSYFWTGIFFLFQCFLFVFKFGYHNISKGCPEFLTWLILKSSVGRQFYQRVMHLDSICKQLKRRQSLSLQSWNIIVSIFLDVLIGSYVAYNFTQWIPNTVLLQNIMSLTNELIDWLQCLLTWLMGVPAGLKLNIPLNNALGHFFLFHIHLWRTYIDTFVPVFKALVKVLSLIGYFGLTCIPSLVIDLSCLLTVHIYCFYGYASRIYYYQLTCLSMLWRVFRGKKWNPETQRVESFTYEVHNLYIGTLLFTVLLFLLPTVMVYYFVFAALRIAVLLIQGLLSRIIKILTVLPIYAILLRIFQSNQTTGEVYFSVLKSASGLVFAMEVVQLDVFTVIKRTIPETENYEVPLSLKSFAYDFIRGKIIYPI